MFETEHLDLSTKVGNKCPKCLLNDHEEFTVLMQSNDAHIDNMRGKIQIPLYC